MSSQAPNAAAPSGDMSDRQETLLDFAVSQSPAVFYIAALGGERPVRFISANVEALTGHAASAFLEEPRYGRGHIHPDDLPGYDRALDQLRGAGSLSHEYRLADASGEYRWFRDELRLIREGGREEFVGCMIDITETVEARAERERYARLLQDAVESMPNGFVVLDRHFKLLAANDALTERYRLSPDPVDGTPFEELVRRAVSSLRSFDGRPVSGSEAGIRRIVDRFEEIGQGAVEVELVNGEWRLMKCYPTAEGGRVIFNLDVTAIKRAEIVTRESEEHFRTLVESHPLAVWMVEIGSGRVLYESPAAAELAGRAWRPGEERTILDNYADIADRAGFVAALTEKGELRNYPIHFRRADGSLLWVSATSRLITFRGQRVHITSLIDLTEQREREAELRRARENLEDAIESLSEGFVLYDAADRLVLCNSQYKQFNAGAEDLLVPGAAWPEVTRKRAERGLFAASADGLEEWLAGQIAQHGVAQNQEFEFTEGRWYEYSHRKTRQGGFVSTWRDITEAKAREAELRRARETLEDAIEALSDGLAPFDPDDRLVMCNERFRESNAMSAHALEPGVAWLDFNRTGAERGQYPDADGRIEEWLDETATERGTATNAQFQQADGRWFEYSHRVTRQGGLVVTRRDITGRREVESEMARQREVLHQSEKLSAMGELLAGVAHELNNPLSVVVGQALLLRETAADERIAARADKIGAAADRCARIVKSFLAMARQEPRERQPTDVNAIVEAGLDLTAYTLRSSDIEVSSRLARDLPAVMADPDQLGQVITNLLVNAQQALQEVEGARRIRVTTTFRKHKGLVVIKVKDNGPGIPEHLRGRIFEPLFTTKEVGVGTGIGLALCHRVVETHGGTIAVEGPPGDGAALVIRLPAVANGGPEWVEDREEASRAPGHRILVVDDEASVTDLLADILRGDGHKVTTANSGREALDRIGHGAFDILLSDLRMPELDGPSLFRLLEEREPALVARTGFVTGDTMSAGIKRFLESSGRPYIEKPITPREVRALIDRIEAGT